MPKETQVPKATRITSTCQQKVRYPWEDFRCADHGSNVLMTIAITMQKEANTEGYFLNVEFEVVNFMQLIPGV